MELCRQLTAASKPARAIAAGGGALAGIDMNNDEPNSPSPEVEHRYNYPLPVRPEAEEDGPEAERALLCEIPAAEADALCKLLESQGISCELSSDANSPDVAALAAGHLAVLVNDAELDLARELMTDPVLPAADAREEEEFERENERSLI